jgi:hypothetical protein
MTNTIFSLWFLALGLVGILRPTLCFRSEKLAPEQIARNVKILRWGGLGFVICGVAGLAFQTFWI